MAERAFHYLSFKTCLGLLQLMGTSRGPSTKDTPKIVLREGSLPLQGPSRSAPRPPRPIEIFLIATIIP